MKTKRKTALRTHPALWEQVKAEVIAGDRGGLPGQWSARKAQMAVAEYKARGGGYIGPKSPDNALVKWTRERWRTRSGLPSLVTGERYLPAKAIAALSPQEYERTSARKRAGMRRGQQFVPQPETIAKKTARYRKNSAEITVVRVVIFDTKGRVLLLRRSETDDWAPGFWNLPGGRRDKGESPMRAALRELSEETGIRAPALVPLGTVPMSSTELGAIYGYGVPAGTKVRLDFEHDAYRWLEIDDVPEWPTIPSTIPGIALALSGFLV